MKRYTFELVIDEGQVRANVTKVNYTHLTQNNQGRKALLFVRKYSMKKWNEATIGSLLARKVFNSDLCVLPNTVWTGHEVDLLVCTTDLYLIDVEIKISSADLKADANKDKWWKRSWGRYNPTTKLYETPEPEPREYPVKIWKHYYAMPATIWKEDLLEHIQPISGVLLVDNNRVECIRRAKPNRQAEKIQTEHAIELARLASFRMWDAYKKVELLQEQLNLD